MHFIEKYKKVGGNVLQHGTTGDGAGFVAYKPTSGVSTINILAIVTMGNAADLTLTVRTSDDAAGTNAAALSQNVPIWKDGVRLTDAKAITEGAATGTYVYEFQVPAGIIPDGKFLGIASDAGNINNIYSAIAIEDVYYSN